jgi:hypothetical protein
MYDNSILPPDMFIKIIGKIGFAEIISRKKCLFDILKENLNGVSFVSGIYLLNNHEDGNWLSENFLGGIVHMFSYSYVYNKNDFLILLEKFAFSQNNFFLEGNGKPVLLYFKNKDVYREFIEMQNDNVGLDRIKERLAIHGKENTCIVNIHNYENFIDLLSGGFNSRFFNIMHGEKYFVTKTSSDISKIKKEYTYYHLLPNNMKQWSVMPINYREENGNASYDMERLYIPDMAVRWIHKSISLNEFSQFLDKIFYYISNRESRCIDSESYLLKQNELYLKKTNDRINNLIKNSKWDTLAAYIKHGAYYKSIEDIYTEFNSLYQMIVHGRKFHNIAVIGHGDLCFSNILYDNATGVLRLIDPKGALSNEELWTDPYYDIAKLSHSICGNYDFITNGLFEIVLTDDMKMELQFDSTNTNEYIRMFYDKLNENNFDKNVVRLFEASLFISMLPLHIENPKKVLGFVLNAINILKEVRGCLK